MIQNGLWDCPNQVARDKFSNIFTAISELRGFPIQFLTMRVVRMRVVRQSIPNWARAQKYFVLQRFQGFQGLRVVTMRVVRKYAGGNNAGGEKICGW